MAQNKWWKSDKHIGGIPCYNSSLYPPQKHTVPSVSKYLGLLHTNMDITSIINIIFEQIHNFCFYKMHKHILMVV